MIVIVELLYTNIRLHRIVFLPERRKRASGWEKNLLYPMVMLILLTGTVSVPVRLERNFCLIAVLAHLWITATAVIVGRLQWGDAIDAL